MLTLYADAEQAVLTLTAGPPRPSRPASTEPTLNGNSSSPSGAAPPDRACSGRLQSPTPVPTATPTRSRVTGALSASAPSSTGRPASTSAAVPARTAKLDVRPARPAPAAGGSGTGPIPYSRRIFMLAAGSSTGAGSLRAASRPAQ